MSRLPLSVSNHLRRHFSAAMSDMYRHEVPQYGTLLGLVGEVNQHYLGNQSLPGATVNEELSVQRLSEERHGAIRLGTAAELAGIRRLLAVFGMYPVGYYDLSVAGIPVHSTAFRPIDSQALAVNPFRIFTSLLRIDLIADNQLRQQAEVVLSQRKIFSDELLNLSLIHI